MMMGFYVRSTSCLFVFSKRIHLVPFPGHVQNQSESYGMSCPGRFATEYGVLAASYQVHRQLTRNNGWPLNNAFGLSCSAANGDI